jgi:integrase
MSHPDSSTNGWAEQHRDALTTNHSPEDVLNEREFERMLEACQDIPEPRGFEARFICLLGGRLGLRAGEIAHFKTGWIDWNRKLVQIPKHEPCGCVYCQRQARQGAVHTDDLTPEAALRTRWHPKTVASARSIPFDLSLRIELCIERFANRYEGFPRSRSTINRRVKGAAEQARLTGRVYVRATAASHHAYKGVAPVPLQALMGWSDLATAQKYIRISGTATADALRQVHHR